MIREEFQRCLDFIKNGHYFEEGCGLDLSTQPCFEDAAWEVFNVICSEPQVLQRIDKISIMESKSDIFKGIDNEEDNIITDKIHSGNKNVMYLDLNEVYTVKELIVEIVENIYASYVKEKNTFEFFALNSKIKLLEQELQDLRSM